MARYRRINVRGVVVEEFGKPRALDEVNRGFELMEAQDGIRSVIQDG